MKLGFLNHQQYPIEFHQPSGSFLPFNLLGFFSSWLVNLPHPPPRATYSPGKEGFWIAVFEGNPWVFISPAREGRRSSFMDFWTKNSQISWDPQVGIFTRIVESENSIWRYLVPEKNINPHKLPSLFGVKSGFTHRVLRYYCVGDCFLYIYIWKVFCPKNKKEITNPRDSKRSSK